MDHIFYFIIWYLLAKTHIMGLDKTLVTIPPPRSLFMAATVTDDFFAPSERFSADGMKEPIEAMSIFDRARGTWGDWCRKLLACAEEQRSNTKRTRSASATNFQPDFFIFEVVRRIFRRVLRLESNNSNEKAARARSAYLLVSSF